jgi:hypothetical protein
MPEKDTHSHQLVLKFHDDVDLAPIGCEDIGDVEDLVADLLGNPDDDPDAEHNVDGNSFGGGTFEIFVHTVDPIGAFDVLRRAWARTGVLDHLTAAYRELAGDDFKVLWPPDFHGEFDPA